MVSIVGIRGSIKATSALEVGFKRHGDLYKLVDSREDASDADCFIQTNLLKPKFYKMQERASAYQYILDSNKPFLVLESPVFRKYPAWTRLGWYSYKWSDGIFGNENSPSNRWNKFQKETGIVLKDWHSPGDSILIMAQKEGDSSLLKLYENYNRFYDWLEELIIDIRKYSDRPIIIRPHPRNNAKGVKLASRLQKKLKDPTITISQNTDSITDYLSSPNKADGLYEDLKKAYCVITYNSLSSIESICEGIPTFAMEDGSMIWPIAHKDLSQIENLNYSIDRFQWSCDIAYTQWTGKEHASGESWAHLKPLMFKE